MFSEDNYTMWLGRINGIGLKKKEELLDYFGSAKDIFYAHAKEIRDFCMKKRIKSENILDIRDEEILSQYVNELYNKKIKYISKNNNEYPELLKTIPDPPLGLYMIGEMPSDDLNKVGIIGARKCTQYGAMNAYKFGKELAEQGVVIVSGMAMGIDAMAHKGAVDGGGKTIAILGCGVDIVYPTSNRSLRDDIIKNGCVISEFPPDTPPFATHFPMRNRIISGISDALVVVESAKRSGTLITVGQALEQGRDVYAIPGNINSMMSQGTNDLIKDCAYPLTEVNDILDNLGVINKFCENTTKKEHKDIIKDKNIEKLLATDEKIVYACIGNQPITIDELVAKTQMSIQKLQYNLTMLELKGHIQKLSGQKYIKTL